MTLIEVITDADNSILILPSFQRGFSWKAENMRKLLESLVLNYPIGGVLLWRTNHATFGWKSLQSVQLIAEREGIEIDQQDNAAEPPNYFKYILDGQQRLTSIYKIFPPTFNRTPYETQNNVRPELIYRFFIDLSKLGFPNLSRENYQGYVDRFPVDIDSIANSCTVKSFRKIRVEYTAANNGQLPNVLDDIILLRLFQTQKLLPLTRSFLTGDLTILNNWIASSVFQLTLEFGGGLETNQSLNQIYQTWLLSFTQNIQTILIQKTVPVIYIPENTSSEGLARIFETINATGLSLTTFDLLVARLSSFTINNVPTNLRDLIKITLSDENFSDFDDKENLGGVACQQLPRIFAVTARTNINQPLPIEDQREISLKKSEILSFNRQSLIDVSQESCEKLKNGLEILKIHLGVRNKGLISFNDAITLAAFVEPNEVNRFKAYYWYVLFTEKDLDKDSNSTTKRLYDTWNARFKNTNPLELVQYVGINLNTAFPTFDEVLKVSNKSSLLYRAFLTYVYTKSTIDWANVSVQDCQTTLEDHHIFPTRWLEATIQGITSNLKNNVLNKVLVSKLANGPTFAFNNAPANYLNNFNNLANFLLPISIVGDNPGSVETLESIYEHRYNLLKSSITNDIIGFIN